MRMIICVVLWRLLKRKLLLAPPDSPSWVTRPLRLGYAAFPPMLEFVSDFDPIRSCQEESHLRQPSPDCSKGFVGFSSICSNLYSKALETQGTLTTFHLSILATDTNIYKRCVCVISLLNLVTISVQIYVVPGEEMIWEKGSKMSDLKMPNSTPCLPWVLYLYPWTATDRMPKIAVFLRQIPRELCESQ